MLDLVSQAMRKGLNQYAPMPGLPALREAIAEKTTFLYGTKVNPDTEITVVSGASEALFNALACLISAGDEVVIFEPAYDLYVPAINLFGGVAVPVALNPTDYSIDWAKAKEAITPKTRAIIINTPHNPTGAVLYQRDLQELQRLVAETDIFVLSDEVYEHIIFDGIAHESVLKYPDLLARSFVISSFGKTYHTTGWKIGYCIAPAELTKEFRKIHQFNTFSTSTPMQVALAEFIKEKEHYLELPDFYQERRDRFRALMQETAFKLLPCAGTYFQLASYAHLSQERDTDYAIRLTREVGVATIPVSVFYTNQTDHKVIRFCFAKRYETLEQGIDKLIKGVDKLKG
jgi:methionine transaminase